MATDRSAIANALRTKVTSAGLAYEGAALPQVLQESAEHQNWRITMLSRLRACDRIAASVDGKPPTTIDPKAPKANAILIRQRLIAAADVASPAVASLITVMMKSPLPAEPPVSAGDTESSVGVRSPEESERVLIAALEELRAYLTR
jgi:hypothetical protein